MIFYAIIISEVIHTNTRIKAIRKEAGLTQTEFGERIGIKQNTVAVYESGTREPIDAIIRSICTSFNVSESWLRTGEGEMHPPRDRLDEIAEIVNESLHTTPEEARDSLIARLSRLSDGEIILLSRILDRMFPN